MARTGRGFAQEMKRAMAPIKRATKDASSLGRNAEWMGEARDVTAANNRQTFATGGSSIGARWGSRDYVVTGRLRRQLTTANLLASEVTDDTVKFNARVEYERYHARNILGWSPKSRKRLADMTAKFLKRVAEGHSK